MHMCMANIRYLADALRALRLQEAVLPTGSACTCTCTELSRRRAQGVVNSQGVREIRVHGMRGLSRE